MIVVRWADAFVVGFQSRTAAERCLAELKKRFEKFGLALHPEKTRLIELRPKVKITEVKTAEVRVHGHQTHVRVYTDAGLIGQGEATDAAVGTAALVRSFKPLLVGKDPLNVDAVWEQIRVAGIFAGAQGGQYITALSVLEIALWDLAGKVLELPIYQLLGGKFRDRVRIYCDSDMKDPLSEEAGKKKEWIKANGFTAMKIDIDDAKDPARFDAVNWTASNGEVDRMLNWVRHTRKTIPKAINELELWKSFVKKGEIISEGHISPTGRPGIGVEMNEQAARGVQIPGTPWFSD